MNLLEALYFPNPNIIYEEKIRGKREETRPAGMMRIQTFITMYVTPQNMRLSCAGSKKHEYVTV